MNTKIKLYVDRIIEFEHAGTYGFVFEINRIIKDIFTIFNQRDAKDLLMAATNNSDGISYMHVFANLIVYLHLRNDLQSGSLALFDCLNDVDIALDMYNHFTAQGFDKTTKDDFMKQFLELEPIYDSQKGLVEFTTEELIIPLS